MFYDYLERPKKHVRRERRTAILLLSVVQSPLWVLLCMAIVTKELSAILLLGVLLLPTTALLLYDIRKQTKLLHQFAAIEEKQSINKTYDVVLYRPKVGFLNKSKLSLRHDYAPEYYGLVLTDYQKNRYYFFFGETIRYDKGAVKRIQEKLYRELHLQCYEGTYIIKTLENDPYFLRVKFGTLYDS